MLSEYLESEAGQPYKGFWTDMEIQAAEQE